MKNKYQQSLMAYLAAMLGFFAPNMHAGEAESELLAHGERLFKKCRSCHVIEDPELASTKQNHLGPNLFGVDGRLMGSLEGFKYSEALSHAGETGRFWDAESLDAYLKSPKAYFPGTNMNFIGIADGEDRAALVAFLLSAKSVTAMSDPPVSEEILAIEGDMAYGEYLASGCLTCHQADGSNQGLPSITNWPIEQFVTVMHAYKNKHRENSVMQQHAGALSDEEIAALAVYFEAQKPAE